MKRESDRREHPRQLCADFVQVTWHDQRGYRLSYVGLIEDVSPDGLCLNLDLPLPAGATVHLHTKGFEGEAQVVYCELGDYGYLAGLEFQEGHTWDRARWEPKHLLGELSERAQE